MNTSPSATPKREEDVRECTLTACHRVGLYSHIGDHNSGDFLERACVELVAASGDACPLSPPYNDYLMTFRQAMRSCLEGKGHSGFGIYLQRLCTEAYTWRKFCAYHADRL